MNMRFSRFGSCLGLFERSGPLMGCDSSDVIALSTFGFTDCTIVSLDSCCVLTPLLLFA
ncbi:MAG: hypothetical protein QOF88_221 [Mycobacterium sp.]|jgi:hypothetical protein|nr:hypothetical protein [Mycobacterium sp.]